MSLPAVFTALPIAIAVFLVAITVLSIHAKARQLETQEREFGDFPSLPSREATRPKKRVFRLRALVGRAPCGPVATSAYALAATGAVFLLSGLIT